MPDLDQRTADKVNTIRQRLSRDADAARSNGDLTDDARVRIMAKAYTNAKADMDNVERAFNGTATESAESLTQQVFGASNVTGVDAISARDADDRAAQLKDGAEALELLSRTESNGDKVLARAIALRAFNARRDFFGPGDWAPVLDRYCETHPGVAEKILKIEDARTTNMNAANMFAFVLPKPSELGRYSDYALIGLGAAK